MNIPTDGKVARGAGAGEVLAAQAYAARDHSQPPSNIHYRVRRPGGEPMQLVVPPAPWCQPSPPQRMMDGRVEALRQSEVHPQPHQNSTQEMVSKLKDLKGLFPTLKSMQDNSIVGTTVSKTPDGSFKIEIKCDRGRQVTFGENEGQLSNGADPTKPNLGKLKKIDLAPEQSFTLVPDGKGNYQVKDIQGIKATVEIKAFGKSVELVSPLPPYTIGADGQPKQGPGSQKEIADKVKTGSKELLKLVQQIEKSEDNKVTLSRNGEHLEVREEKKSGKATQIGFTRTGEHSAHIVNQSAEGTAKPVPGHPHCTQIVSPTVSFNVNFQDRGNIDVTQMSGSYVVRQGLLMHGVVGGVDRLSLWHDSLGHEHLTASGWQRGPLGRVKPMSRSLDGDLYQGRSQR